ncbi:MAG: aminotransferase class I/II-fold pyridoxal phosphate-dependent enzyme [Actinomycetota bacterium]
MTSQPFVPPPYPYDRLDALAKLAAKHDGGVIDLSIGTPCDAPTAAVVAALSSSNTERGYPPSIGSEPLRTAARDWMRRRFNIDMPIAQIAACVGSKEFVATTPQYMKLRRPDRDTVLYPAVSYPTYEMGAILAGCRAVPVPMNAAGGLDLSGISAADAARALMLWVNSPSNPTGALDDLAAAAAWGHKHGVTVFSDECYVEFTWSRSGESILQHGLDGVVALHSLSKRSNLAGVRVAFYAGDADIVNYLKEVRKHVGMMVPGPAQAAGVVALNDDAHVATQRDVYARRLQRTAEILSKWSGIAVPQPAGGFYLWFDAADGWQFAERLARDGGTLVSPGDFYGAGGANNVRVAVVQPDARIELLAKRLGV